MGLLILTKMNLAVNDIFQHICWSNLSKTEHPLLL
jgi:hypothetical protein